MAQFIKYEHTTVDPDKSATEIQALCRKYGAVRYEVSWNDDDEIQSIRFTMRSRHGPVPVLLAAPSERIYKLFRKHRPSGDTRKQRVQAKRIAWRHLKDLTEQTLLSAHLGIQDAAVAFMGSIEREVGAGVTLGQEMLESAAELGPDGLRPLLRLKSG